MQTQTKHTNIEIYDVTYATGTGKYVVEFSSDQVDEATERISRADLLAWMTNNGYTEYSDGTPCNINEYLVDNTDAIVELYLGGE